MSNTRLNRTLTRNLQLTGKYLYTSVFDGVTQIYLYKCMSIVHAHVYSTCILYVYWLLTIFFYEMMLD
jgi:hypothetical protein